MIADAAFIARLRSLLHHEAPQGFACGDDDLNPGYVRERPESAPREAAVLVPLIGHADGISVLLTRRTAHLAKHAGQIAFPGGKIDETDGGPVEAALREAEEEIGLPRAHVTPLGFLDGYLTGTHYRVTPVVGLVKPGFILRPEPSEVEAVFEVPLAFLMDARNHHTHTRQWLAQDRHFYAMPYGEHYIWGATAGMLKNLHNKVFAAEVLP